MKLITKWRFIVAVVAALAACLYVFARQAAPVVELKAEPNSAHAATHTTQTKNTPVQSAAASSSTASSTSNMTQAVSEEEYKKLELAHRAKMELVKRWKQERSMSPDNAPEYKSYSIETLEKLARGGDVVALTTLADKYELQNDPVSKSKAGAARRKAIALGSTYALGRESAHYEAKAFLERGAPLKAKAHIMHSMALKKVSVMRGDPLDYIMDSQFPEYKSQKFNLNENDFIQINSFAQKIYDGYQAQRHTLGLGDFDNSVPEIVQESYDRIPRKEGVKGY